MMILTGSADESQIYLLDDDSEIEITVIELEGRKSKVVICTDKEVEVTHKIISNSE